LFLLNPVEGVVLPPKLRLGECTAADGEPVCIWLDAKYNVRSEALGWNVYRIVPVNGGPTFRISAYDDSAAKKTVDCMNVFCHELSKLDYSYDDIVTPLELAQTLADPDNPHDGAFRVDFQRRCATAPSEVGPASPPVTEG